MSTLTAYRVAPQMEFKAAQEQEQFGIDTILPTSFVERPTRKDKKALRQVPTARGYIFTGYKHAASKHIKTRVGPVNENDVRRLFIGKPDASDKFRPGDEVQTKLGAFAEIIGKIRGKTKTGYIVEFPMFGKHCAVFLPEKQLTHHIHPG